MGTRPRPGPGTEPCEPPCGPQCGRRLPPATLSQPPSAGSPRTPRTPRTPRPWPHARLLLAVLPVLLLFLLASRPAPASAKPIAMASPDQVLENMRQIPQWHCLRYRKFDLVTQHKRCRHFRADRKH